MANFIGSYEVTLDLKGRFLLPAKFCKQLADSEAESKRFVITHGLGNYLLMFLPQHWNDISENINEMDDLDEDARAFKSMFLSPAEEVESDNQDRMAIPRKLLDYAGINKDMMMIPSGDKMELWNTAAREAYVNENKPKMGAINQNVTQKFGSPFRKRTNG